MRTVRMLMLFFLSYLVFVSIGESITSLQYPLFFLSIVCIFELFFRYFIAHVGGSKTVEEITHGQYTLSCTPELLHHLVGESQTSSVIRSLLSLDQVVFIMRKMGIVSDVIPHVDISESDVLIKAAELVKQYGGKNITTIDFFGAYILLIESQSKLLFNSLLKEKEFIELLYWARNTYSFEETSPKRRVKIYGSGIGEVLTTGWTLETKKYTQDFSYRAYSLQPHILGREKEFNAVLEGLSKKGTNNVLLIGDVGSGRENLVAYVSMASFDGKIARGMNHVKILQLMIGPLIAGAANRAELETRLQAIIEEVSHSGNVMLYIPEFQNIVGSSTYNVDLSGALFPYLQSGNLPIIASVTTGNYKTYIEKSPLKEVFSLVRLEEPDTVTAIRMIEDKAATLEQAYGVILTYKAIQAAVQYADRYFTDAALPGSAASLLEDVANKVKTTIGTNKGHSFILEEHVISVIENKTHIALSTPQGEEKDLLLHLEERLHERVIEQTDAIKAIAEAMRRLRTGLVSSKRPVSFLFLGPTGVGKTETAKALASLYFGGEEHMIRLDMSEYADAEGVKRLLGAAPGQGEERGELTDKMADHPFSLVLLDEFEKAYPKILDLFLQVLEDGRLTDNKGKTVSFVNSIIIATSNAGAEFIREEIKKGTIIDKDFSHKLLDALQSGHMFRPELLNRFDDVIIFKPLGDTEMRRITELLLKDIRIRLAEQDITVIFDTSLIDKIAQEGFDPEFGARPLRRYIQNSVEDILAQKKLLGEIARGNTVHMSVDQQNAIVLQVQ